MILLELLEQFFQMNQFDFVHNTTQKMKFFIKDFFIKCHQIRRKLRIWSHLQKKSLMENFIFCVVQSVSWLSFLMFWQALCTISL